VKHAMTVSTAPDSTSDRSSSRLSIPSILYQKA
jgi:hypothetical protein